MTRTEGHTPIRREHPAREPHHEQTRSALLLRTRHRRCRGREKQLAEMNLVHSDIVLGVISGVRARAKLGADGDLSRQANN